MKIAITSTGNTLESLIDSSFGRCSWFVIYDTENKAMEFLPNPFKEAAEASGSSAVQLLVQKKVNKIVAGDFGMKIKPMLDSLRIQMIVVKDPQLQINQIIELLNH